MSTPPPMQPPWIAAITGMRARSRQVKVSCSAERHLRRLARVRPISAPSPVAVTPASPVKTARSMPAVKCLPVDDSTIARAPPLVADRVDDLRQLASRTRGVMVLSSAARFS